MSTAFPDESATESRRTLSGLGHPDVPRQPLAPVRAKQMRDWILDVDDDTQDPVLRPVAVTSAALARRRGSGR